MRTRPSPQSPNRKSSVRCRSGIHVGIRILFWLFFFSHGLDASAQGHSFFLLYGNSGDPKAKANGVEKKNQSEVRSGLLLLTAWPGGAAAPFRPFIPLPGICSSLIQNEQLGDIDYRDAHWQCE